MRFTKFNIKFCVISFISVLSILISINSFARCEPDNKFPLRIVYLMVDCIDMDDFVKKVDEQEVVVVDARTNTEYQIIKIKKAINLSLEDRKDFIKKVKLLRKRDPRPIAFYCNGHNCSVSYKAAKLAQESGVKDVYVFDEGIFNYSEIRPENTLLLGNEISGNNKPISKEQFKQHLLSPDAFNKKVLERIESGEKYSILDVRTQSNRHGVSAFVGIPYKKYIPIDKTQKLEKYLGKISQSDNDLFVYDWSGKQLKWVQYYINNKKIKNYYFLKGGASARINEELKNMGMTEMIN